MRSVVKGIFSISIFLLFSNIANASKIISCPALNASHYGKSSYYDQKSGKSWVLTWNKKLATKKLVWDSVSIPEAATCGVGKSSTGLPLKYQCVILQCKSDAVVAALGQHNLLKCYSAYLSTKKTFYCEDFKLT